jgi:hypothetical protein
VLTVHLLAISRTRISCHDALERTACAPFREVHHRLCRPAGGMKQLSMPGRQQVAPLRYALSGSQGHFEGDNSPGQLCPGKKNCHPDRSVSRWRDLLLISPVASASSAKKYLFLLRKAHEVHRNHQIPQEIGGRTRAMTGGQAAEAAGPGLGSPKLKIIAKKHRILCRFMKRPALVAFPHYREPTILWMKSQPESFRPANSAPLPLT